jgi:hypothetical protein
MNSSKFRRFVIAGCFWLSMSFLVLPPNLSSIRAQTPQCSGTDETLITGRVQEELWEIGGYTNKANQTVHWEHSTNNPGIMGFSLTREGPFTNTLSVPVTLDSTGSATTTIYLKGLTGGQTIRTTCVVDLTPTPMCDWVEHWTVKGCACPPISPIQ